MDVADKLCDTLFHLIEKQEQYADHLMALAEELEEWSMRMTADQLVGNTATIVGSATLIETGIAALMTEGLASPLLAEAAGATGVAGSVTSVTCNLLDKLKSSETMKKAEKTAKECEEIQNIIKDLSEECESLDLEALKKNVSKEFGQAVGGGLGLVLTVPDFIDNCEELITKNHHTEASLYLRTKAKEIREAVQKLKTHLNELQEMLRQIPEMECHMDLAQKMLCSETYTQGTICIKFKQSKKQDKSFILLCNKDIGAHRCGFINKHTPDDTKTKRQKSAIATKSSTSQQLSEESSSSDEEEEFCLPTITLSNVRSLPNKMEEIKVMMEYVENFNNDLIVFTETWLNRNSPGISLNGYEPFQQDRDPELTGKKRGGGLILFVNKDWAGKAMVTTWKMTKDYEIMVVHITPHKPTKKVKLLTYIIVYVPGHVKEAAHKITEIYKLVSMSSNLPRVCPVFLLGDFNKCDISSEELEQYVTCPTREKNILDKCYGNVPGAYISYCRPPLGKSDHNVIYLFPKDKTNNVGECKHE